MDQKKNNYEGMFLLDAGQPNTEAALEPVRTVLDRAQADVLSLKSWDERRLAYDIKGRKRGLYVLGYFKLDSEKVTELEHDCQLNEKIVRMLILRKDTITEEELQAATPAETALAKETPTEEAPAETTPAESTPAKETPTEEAPAEAAPAETAPAKETPTKEAPAEATPAKETPTEEAPTEAAPVATEEAETAEATQTPVEDDANETAGKTTD